MSMRVRNWLAHEWRYQERKFDREARNRDTATFGSEDDQWRRGILMYYDRAVVLGLDNPLGRQALAKCVATAVAMLDDVILTHGPLPPAGVPSGELSRGDH